MTVNVVTIIAKYPIRQYTNLACLLHLAYLRQRPTITTAVTLTVTDFMDAVSQRIISTTAVLVHSSCGGRIPFSGGSKTGSVVDFSSGGDCST